MKILSICNYPYFRPGGGLITMRALYRQLAACGHRVVAVHTFTAYSPVAGRDVDNRESAKAFLEMHGVASATTEDGSLSFQDGDVEVHYVRDAAAVGPFIDPLVAALQPDWVQLAAHESDAIGDAVLSRVDASKVVFTCHATEGLPFGPRALRGEARTLEHLRASRGIWVPSEYVQRYLAQHADLESAVVRVQVYGDGPFPHSAAWDEGAVTLINNSVPKGLPVFNALAKSFPDVPFAVVPTWDMGGYAKPDDLGTNVSLISPVANREMDRIYSKVRVLLAPSLLHEAFGLVVVEAMLRGIPVLASDIGGLPEAKLGVPALLPVSPIEWDTEAGSWTVPTQNVAPWRECLGELLADRQLYEELSTRSRQAALDFVSSLSIQTFEHFLAGLQ